MKSKQHMATACLYQTPRCKAAHKSKAEIKNKWRYKSTPPYALMKYIETN